MDTLVASKLSQFFDNLLGDDVGNQHADSQRKENRSKKKKKLKKAAQSTKEIQVDESPGAERKKEKPDKKQRKKDVQESPSEPVKSQSLDVKTRTFNTFTQEAGEQKPEKEKFTDDGFKIVSSIPDDDSDVSDAFEYDSEAEDEFSQCQKPESVRKPNTKVHSVPSKMTKDGFKIVEEIPPDDSDISDAFEGDEGLGMEPETGSESLHKNVKKPILQIMNDFGIGDDIFHGKPQELKANRPTVKKRKWKGTTNTVTHAGKRKGETHVTVLDYTKRRGAGTKKTKSEKDEALQPQFGGTSSSDSKTLDEKQLKRVRYDVFKLGMSGFDKQKKEDTRVALAIRLGAKPPKNKHINYNEFLAKRREEKRKEAEEREMQRKQGMKVFKPRKSEERPVVKATTAQIGRYKHGVQVLSRRDIAKIQGVK